MSEYKLAFWATLILSTQYTLAETTGWTLFASSAFWIGSCYYLYKDVKLDTTKE